MNNYEVVGFRPYDFKGEDGRQITGYTIYVTFPLSGKNCEGREAIKLSVPERIGYVPHVGDIVDISFNRSGKVAAVELVM